MFKLESYLTPLLHGYVVKYVKNLKSEDFQLSLWGGDAVFSNLDLRLDVLEEEFHFPFTFTNGHIHELKLHVPWTKLGSEPIVITIETIECVLTLKQFNGSDGSSSENSKTKSDVPRKKPRKAELTPETPPGYVQGFINRIINNISVVCNNLILKYVEDDIVLSLNIKSAEMYNVDEGWEKAFTDLNALNPVLRRVVNMHDLTICLDKRNASGIIEVYQDPLLFRCSAWCRIYKRYESPHSKMANLTHISIYCDQLDYSVTDQQLPMLAHLMDLCLALYNGDLKAEQKAPSGNNKPSSGQDEGDEAEEGGNEEDQGWGSWAWSYVPQIMPIWDQEGDLDAAALEASQQPFSQTFRFRFLVERMSLVFKLTQRLRSSKVSFHSEAVLRQYGTSMDIIDHGGTFLNCQLGVTAAEVIQLDTCLCGGASSNVTTERAILQSGIMPGEGHTYSFLTASLFDPLSPENGSNEAPQLELDWDRHLDCLTEQVMLDRFPALAIDYLYELEIPPDFSDKLSELTGTFLEGSNWQERSLSRLVLGRACLNVTSGLVHLVSKINSCAKKHDYTPYTTPHPVSLSSLPSPTEDDLQNTNIVPTRSYHLVWHQPNIRVHLPDHALGQEKSRRKSSRIQQDQKSVNPNVPILIRANTIDLSIGKSFYPKKIAHLVYSVTEPSDVLLHHSFIHTNFKAFQLELSLLTFPREVVLVPPFNIASLRKSLQDPALPWETEVRALGKGPPARSEVMMEVDQWQVNLSKGQLHYLLCFGSAWYWDAPLPSNLQISGLIAPADKNESSCMSVKLGNFDFRFVDAWKSYAIRLTLQSFSLQIMEKGEHTVAVKGPENTSCIHSLSFFREDTASENLSGDPLLTCVVQFPIDTTNADVEQSVVSLQLKGFVVNLDPVLFTWMDISLDPGIFSAPTMDFVPQSGNSNASSPSNDMSSTYSLSQATSAATLDKKITPKAPPWQNVIIDLYQKILKNAVIMLEVQPICLMWPSCSWPSGGGCSSNPQDSCMSLVSSWRQVVQQGQVVPLCLLVSPHITLGNQSANTRWQPTQLAIPLMDIPHGDKFPWTVNFQGCSIYTVESSKVWESSYIIKPVGASMTLAVSEPASQIALCLHVDMEPLYLSLSKNQVSMLSKVTDQALSGIHQLLKTVSFFTALSRSFRTASVRVPSWQREPVSPGLVPLQVVSPRDKSFVKVASMSSYSVEQAEPTLDLKLTLWMQWTLPKIGLSFLTSPTSLEQVWLQLEAEEVTASLDIQSVFWKGKAKITSFNISNFCKGPENADWQPGSMDGIILCGLDKISRKMVLSTNRSEYKPSQSSSNKSFPSFLSLTFTRVLCSSVEQYCAKKLKDMQLETSTIKSNQTESTSSSVVYEQTKYISEFDMKLDRFDVVLWVPLLSSVVDIASPVSILVKNPLLSDLVSSKDPSGNRVKRPLGWGLNVSALPLLYLHVGTVRLFLPSHSGDVKTDKPFDMLMVQVNSVTLLPQADNLLSRIVVNEQMYLAAENSGSLYVPGAPIEDRQYQLDIKGLMLTTVLWEELHERSNISYNLPVMVPPTLGQNPAVEWNNRTVPLEEEDDSILIHPIISPFDLKMVVAPAVVFHAPRTPASDITEESLVCGHSLELNAVSDVEVHLSFQSAALLHEVVQTNLLSGSTQLAENIQGLSPSEGVAKDSGIESEVTSGQHMDMTLLSLLTNPLMAHSNDAQPEMPFVPAEVLLTANRVLLSLFLSETDLRVKLNPGSSGKRKTHRRSKKRSFSSATSADPVNVKKTGKLQKKRDPVSTESSPDRVIPIPPRKPKISRTMGSSEDGYDGSNDSSSTCSTSQPPLIEAVQISLKVSEVKESSRPYPRIHPFLQLVLSQPHTFIMCRAETQKIQVSCFDFNVKSGSHNLFVDALGPACCPLSSHFTVPWLETIPGDTDPKTGTPPPWLTFTCCDFLSSLGEVNITCERPTLLHFSLTRFHQARAVLLSVLPQFSLPLPAEEPPPAPDFPKRLKKMLKTVHKVNISMVHLAASVESGPSTNSEHSLAFSVTGITTNLQLSSDETGEKVLTKLKLQDVVLNMLSGKVCRHVLGPFSSASMVEAWWPAWMTPDPLVTIKVESGPLFLTFAPRQLQVLKATSDNWAEIAAKEEPVDLSSSTARTQKKTKGVLRDPSPLPKVQQEVHTYDDIRNGSFEFLHDWDGQGMNASPGEVVFCEMPSEKQGSMTWCYLQPRILTRVEIYPVPLQSSSDRGLLSSTSSHQDSHKLCKISCCLQYWESFQETFVDWKYFELQESSSNVIDIPLATPNTSHLVACTHKWRVIIKCADPDGDYLPVLPNVLAACMRVDSSFHPAYVPHFQASFNLDFMQITFCNYFRNMAVPDSFYPFVSDGQFLQDQEFMVTSIDNMHLSCKQWSKKLKLNGRLSASCEMLEYRNLTLQMLMEPVDFQLSLLVSQAAGSRYVIENELTVDPCYLRLSQSTLYTMINTVQAWNQFLGPKDFGEQIIPHYYVICNNTQENIRFGQYNTDESVLLGSQKMHAYSWRSQKSKQLLIMCLESVYWKSCSPFDLDSVGTKVRIIETKGYSVTLIIHTRKINSIQNQIVITGQVTVSSRLSQALEVRLLTQPQGTSDSPPSQSWLDLPCLPHSLCLLEPFSTLAAHLRTSAQPMAFQLRLQQVHSSWSQTVHLTDKEAKQLQLIKIPSSQPFDVWCRIITKEILPHVKVYLVILCPAFILRNHLPIPIVAHLQTECESSSRCLEVAGEGQDTELLTNLPAPPSTEGKLQSEKGLAPDDSASNWQLLFQLGSTVQPSSPAVNLPCPSQLNTADIVSQEYGLLCAENVPGTSQHRDLEDLCYNWLQVEQFAWPYLDTERLRKLKELPRKNTLLQYEAHRFSSVSEIPNTQLNVRVYCPWPSIPTYLVDVKPWALFVNHSSWDLYLQAGGPDSQFWQIHKDAVFIPPHIKSTFVIAAEVNGHFYPSCAIQIGSSSSSEESPKNGILILEPQSSICLAIHMVVADNPKILLVSAYLEMKEDMYIVVFRPRVMLSNETDISLLVHGSLGISTPQPFQNKAKNSDLTPPQGQSPLLLWDLVDTSASFLYVMSICPTSEDSWCQPEVLLDLDKELYRLTISTSVSCQQQPLGFVVTCQQKRGSLYVTVHRDLHPLLCIQNRTEFSLIFGETKQVIGIPNEILNMSQLPCIGPGRSMLYTFSSVSEAFPSCVPQLPSLCLARDPSQLQEMHPDQFQQLQEIWSQSIDITSEADLFVHIPHSGDVRVHKERAGHTMHIVLEFVNRVEVSAKEIRSRIAAKMQDEEINTKEVVRISTRKMVPHEKEMSPERNDPIFYLSVTFTHICGILCDDITDPYVSEEVLRFSLDDAFAIVRTVDVSRERLVNLSKQEVTICIGNIQLDNQLIRNVDVFDFKVVVIPQNSPHSSKTERESHDVLSLLAKHSEHAVLLANLSLDIIQPGNIVIVQNLTIKAEPLALYLEDNLYHHVLCLKKSFLDQTRMSSRNLIFPDPLIAKAINEASRSLAKPLPIVQMEIHPVSMLVSLRASLKLYLSVDHSPLSFHKFQQKFLYASSYGLGQLLTVHYVTGALLRAGWVVGSLDLLGNPTGLARALGSGLSDLVCLPYRGLFQGPWAFVSGVSHGTASLLKQISSGTIISVTNLATSISRNMDRLSLDHEHSQRQEEMRHSPPESLTSGLKQGLSSFGLSILGAIAGIVDQPMQALVSSTEEASPPEPRGLLSTATGIVGGTSRGLVGMVVKPIGGAAEFISQAGTGLLQGVGWRNHPLPRYTGSRVSSSSSQSSLLKFSWKMIPVLIHGPLGARARPGPVLMCLEASHVARPSGQHVSDILFLSPHLLAIVSMEEDRHKHFFALTDVDCFACPDYPSILYITCKPKTPTVPVEVFQEATKRVEEYIQRFLSELGQDGSSPTSAENTNVSWRDGFQFYVLPKLRDVFVALFNIEQRKILGKRFPL